MSGDIRHLVLVLGDQLDLQASALDGFDPAQDCLWMAEVDDESTHVPSARMRIAVFLAAMRHHAQALRARGWPLDYRALDATPPDATLVNELAAAIARHRPQALVMTAPGDWRVLQSLRAVAAAHGLKLDLRDDRHFLSTVRDFAAHARGRRELRMEWWYREQRRRHGVLMEGPAGDQPAGGRWNYDADNRAAFGRQGPGVVAPPLHHAPDALTREVIALVNRRFAHHPGRCEVTDFGWPVTREQALASLADFITHRLPRFGEHQDALWTGQPWLWHSALSAALNLKLLGAREVIDAAQAAWRAGAAPLAAVEGYIRQILGWREYVRGLYWTRMPGYAELNALQADQPLPAAYWSGDTDMACLRDALGQTLRLGYAHHIQRLMVTGLYALLLGVRPHAVHAWYLSVYVDAVEWVELPNTLGMSQYADGGLMASKPYAASGQYIRRMSNHCAGCRYDPAQSTGPRACPYTTLYWDFLLRHRVRLAGNARMALPLKHLARLDDAARAAVQEHAAQQRQAEAARAAASPWADKTPA